MTNVEITFHPETLKFCRERAKLTVEQVAKRMKMTPEQLAGWESGTSRPPAYHQLERLAYLYHQSTETFTKSLPIAENFSFGDPDSPCEDDPRYISEEESIHKALEYQNERPFEGVLAVWEDDSGEIVCLICRGIEYSSK